MLFVSWYNMHTYLRSSHAIQGRYIPLFAAEIVDQNAKAVAKGFAPINLQSVAIGNGLSNMMQMWPTHYDIACTSASVEPFMSIAECTEMRRGVRSVFDGCSMTRAEPLAPSRYSSPCA